METNVLEKESYAPKANDFSSRKGIIIKTLLIVAAWFILLLLSSTFSMYLNVGIICLLGIYIVLGVVASIVAQYPKKWSLSIVIAYSVLCLPRLTPLFIVQILSIMNIVSCIRAWKTEILQEVRLSPTEDSIYNDYKKMLQNNVQPDRQHILAELVKKHFCDEGYITNAIEKGEKLERKDDRGFNA